MHMKHQYRKNIMLFLCITITSFLVIIGIVVYFDPFMQYHKPIDGVAYQLDEKAYAYINPGIARNFDYNALVLGSSMTRTVKTSQIKELFNVEAVKLSVLSGKGKDIYDIFQIATEKHDIQTVFLGLDYFAFNVDKDAIANQDEKPTYLYDHNYMNDIEYVLNRSVLFDTLYKDIKHTFQGKDMISMDDYQTYQQQLTFTDEHYRNMISTMYMTKDIIPIEKDYYVNTYAKDNYKQNLEPIIAEHPEIQFYIYYPPFSIGFWYQEEYLQQQEADIEVMRYLASELTKHGNVKLYFPQGNMETISTFSNYGDLQHYSESISELIMKDIALDKNLVTKDNFEATIQTFMNDLQTFDYSELKALRPS